jgi:F-box and WD-40 domain protein MET30
MLRGILSVCCFPQLSFISSSIRDLIKIDFLSLLPPEVSFNILCFLDTTSLCKAAQVCRRWRELADDDVVWHRMCEQHIDRKCTKCGWGLPLLERKRLRTEKRQIQLRALGRGLNEWSPNITPLPESRPHSPHPSTATDTAVGQKRLLVADTDVAEQVSKRLCTQSLHRSTLGARRPWKDVYKARFKVGTNWKYGRCSIKVLKGHTNGVMCLQFKDNILATGSYDSTVKIWDIDTMSELRTLRGHTQGIRCLQFDDFRLMSGSIDGTIRVWDWRTGECQRILSPEKGGVLSLHFGPKYLCAGTMENVVRVWSTCDKVTFTLKGHTDFVNAVKVDTPSRTVFSASDDCTVKIWDL